MPVHALQQHGQQQPLGPGLTVNFMGKFTVDDDDDEEFRLDPLDWLLDDEADVAEEEALLRLVDPSVEALSDLGAWVDPPTTAAAAAAAATSRRRTQREAARRAAERIAAEQQQQWLLKQQQQQQQQLLQRGEPGVVDGVAGPVLLQQQLLQPKFQLLIPAAAAGDVQQHQQQLLDGPPAAAPLTHGPGLGDAAGWVAPGMWQHQPVPGAGAGQQQQHQNHQQGDLGSIPDMQQQQQDASGGLHESWDPSCLQQQQQANHAVLTIRAEQLQQLYQQVSLHTQMLMQLYVLTAVDPSPAAQAMASAVGQMLEQIRRLHAVSTASLRGQQLGQLVQHAFLEAAGSSGGGNGAVPSAMRRLRGHQPGLVWQPPISSMQ
jgi:hypothetical protein